jgi:hypothetical protein
MGNTISIVCDLLDYQRKVTSWYLKKIPLELLGERIEVNGVFLNAPLWIVCHLIWTDYFIALQPFGYKGEAPKWIEFFSLGSPGELPENLPSTEEILKSFDEVHLEKLAFIRTLSESILEQPHVLSHLGFKNNYYALLHLARHEGVHTGGLATFCKLKGFKTI